MRFLAEQSPATHTAVNLCNGSIGPINFCQVNTDDLLSSLIAVVITLALCFWVVRRLKSGTPGKLQMVFELLISYARGLVRENVGEEANFVVPLALTIGLYILVADWLDFFPLFGPVHPANADLNQTAALALVVILVVQGYSLRVLGLRGYLRRFTKPFEMALPVRILFIPLNIIEEIVKPVTLSLRLFGNIFAGAVMVYLLGLLFSWAAAQLVVSLSSVGGLLFTPFSIIGLVIWKLFDVIFIGAIQAFIFMLLTIIYFGMAKEGLGEEHEAPAAQAKAQRRTA